MQSGVLLAQKIYDRTKKTKIKFLTESQDHYNLFNNANLSSICDKIKKKSYSLNYNT